jgi:type I restriction enzyme S subunit
MNTQTLLENFSTLADAPGGIPRLRELILDLAVRGQLIPHTGEQDTEVSCHGQPFPIPDTWSWKAFSELVEFKVGKTPPTKDPSFWGNESSTMWVSIGDMVDGGTVNASNRTITKKAQKEVFKREPWPTGTMLMSFKLTIGKVSRLGQPAFFNEAIFSFDSGDESINEYLFRVLPLLAQSGDSKGAIKGNTLNSESISKLQIPLPPENQRTGIVTKIDELMALCDQLEAAKAERDALCTAARKSAIDAVSTASTPDELSTAWARIRDNWTTYADTPESLSDLRSIILDLAIRGSMAKQDDREVKEPFESVDGPFDLPANWIWSSLEKVGVISPRNTADDDLDVGFVPMALISEKLSTPHQFEIRKWKEIKKGYTHLADGDVALAKITPCFENGKACVVRGLPNGVGAGTTELLVVRSSVVNPDYLLIFLKSNLFTANGIPRMTGTAGQKRLPSDFFKKFPMPIPPYAEQVRIVAKVDELMALCDQLENELKTRNNFAGQWAASVVHHIGDAA